MSSLQRVIPILATPVLPGDEGLCGVLGGLLLMFLRPQHSAMETRP